MKGVAPLAYEAGSEFTFTSSYRGVRGEDAHFPQPNQPIGLPIALEEIQNGLRQQVQRLGWSGRQVAQLIAQKFGGRRRSELQDSELLTLLYHLQTVNPSLFSEP